MGEVSNSKINGLSISKLTQDDLKSACKVFEISIPDAFEKEGLGHLIEDIHNEVLHKKQMLEESLYQQNSDTYFLIAKLEDTVVGTISFGPCGDDIKKCTDNELQGIGELGSLYVLPENQGEGVGSALINALVTNLGKRGIEQFCLDSGYKRAQKRWLRKFGATYKVEKDYWGPGGDHFIWLCNVTDFIG